MTTGKIKLNNQCHDSNDNKFCETPGPGASDGDWPDHKLKYSATGKVELKNNMWEKAKQLGIIQ